MDMVSEAEQTKPLNLIETLPAGWTSLHADGHEPSIIFYFGVDARWSHELPMGERFGVVYSPNQYLHPDERRWYYIVYRVDMCEFRPRHPKERGYVQEMKRDLWPWEVQHFEKLWLEIEIGEMTSS